MKTNLFLLFSVIFFQSAAAYAQQFLPTAATPCSTCAPAGYTKSGGPDISNPDGLGGNSSRPWITPGLGGLPIPPSLYSQGLPGNAGKNSFVSLATSDGIYDDGISLTVNGFTPGKQYTFMYNVLSGSIFDPVTQSNSKFGESAKLEIMPTGQNPPLLKTQTTDFDSNNRNKWISKSISFTPNTTSLVFKFSGHTTGNIPGYINLDIDNHALCPIGPTEVTLSRSSVSTLFPSDKINLFSETNVTSATPPGAEIVWKQGPGMNDPVMTNAEASEAPVSNLDPQNVKSYYPFYYVSSANCYALPMSQTEFKFLYTPTQVPVKATDVVISCPDLTTDLTLLEDTPAASVRWYSNNTHSGLPVFNPKAAPPGDYYAFYYEPLAGTWSLKPGQLGAPMVHVTNAVIAGIPDLGPTININSLIFPPNGTKDFVVKIQNLKAENSNCSVYFKVSKLPGFNITYSTAAGTANINGNAINTNNDLWTFTEDSNYITVTSKIGVAANGYSYIGFKVARGVNTPSGSTQNLSITIPQSGGGGETNIGNNQTITTLMAN